MKMGDVYCRCATGPSPSAMGGVGCVGVAEAVIPEAVPPRALPVLEM